MNIRAHASPWNNGVELLVFDDEVVATGFTTEKRARFSQADPTMKIKMEQAQTLMDDLWTAGLRPTDGAGSAGSLRATENHLKDMQKIAFTLLPKERGQ